MRSRTRSGVDPLSRLRRRASRSPSPTERLGDQARALGEIDLTTFAFGIALGMVIGTFAVELGDLSLGLGTAGGVLLAGLRDAVHAGLAGRTGMVVGFWKNEFTHVPIALAVSERKQIDPAGRLWNHVLAATGQPRAM